MTELLIGLGLALFTAVLGAAGWLIRNDIENDRELTERVFNIEAQMRNNGGASMRDAIDRIEATVTRLDTTLTAHLIHSAGQDARLDAHLGTHAQG